MPYLITSVVMIHYEEVLYQVYASDTWQSQLLYDSVLSSLEVTEAGNYSLHTTAALLCLFDRQTDCCLLAEWVFFSTDDHILIRSYDDVSK